MSEHIYEDSDMENERYHVIPFGSMREEIVRCKDCKFYTDQPGISGEKPNREYCYKYSDWNSEWDYDDYHYVEPDGFCKWGERKDDVEQ